MREGLREILAFESKARSDYASDLVRNFGIESFLVGVWWRQKDRCSTLRMRSLASQAMKNFNGKPSAVLQCQENLISKRIPVLDYLFLAAFDNSHVLLGGGQPIDGLYGGFDPCIV
jgi:hypothetical protein